MLDRRNLLMSGAAAAAVGAIPHSARAQVSTAGGGTEPSARLDGLFDTFVNEQLDHAPEQVTSLGLDVGARAHQRSELADRSLAEAERLKRLVADQLRRLSAFDRRGLNAKDSVGYDVVSYELKTQDAADRRYPYAGGNLQAPYILTQLTGSYQQIPDFLDSQHPIEDKGGRRRLHLAAGGVRAGAGSGNAIRQARRCAECGAAGLRPCAGGDPDERLAQDTGRAVGAGRIGGPPHQREEHRRRLRRGGKAHRVFQDLPGARAADRVRAKPSAKGGT